MGHAAWGSHKGRESPGALGWQPRQLSAAHPQHRVLLLKALAMCPHLLWDLSALHTPQAWLWTNTDLAAQELERLQGLLYPKTSEENAAAWGIPDCWEGGAGKTMLPYREHAGGGLGLKVHSGERYRDGAILRLLPDHLLKPLSMIQRLTGCRQMGNTAFRVQGMAEVQPCSSPYTLLGSYCSTSMQRAQRGGPFPREST